MTTLPIKKVTHVKVRPLVEAWDALDEEDKNLMTQEARSSFAALEYVCRVTHHLDEPVLQLKNDPGKAIGGATQDFLLAIDLNNSLPPEEKRAAKDVPFEIPTAESLGHVIAAAKMEMEATYE